MNSDNESRVANPTRSRSQLYCSTCLLNLDTPCTAEARRRPESGFRRWAIGMAHETSLKKMNHRWIIFKNEPCCGSFWIAWLISFWWDCNHINHNANHSVSLAHDINRSKTTQKLIDFYFPEWEVLDGEDLEVVSLEIALKWATNSGLKALWSAQESSSPCHSSLYYSVTED